MTLRSLTSDENLCTAAAGLESATEFRGQLLKQLFDVSKLVSFIAFYLLIQVLVVMVAMVVW